MSSPSNAGADYRGAMASVAAHRKIQADAELARLRTGIDDGSVARAKADVDWCRALVLACGEVVKGCTFEEAVS